MPSEDTNQRSQGGPGPPYSQQEITRSYLGVDTAGMATSHNPTSVGSPSLTGVSANHHGISNTDQRGTVGTGNLSHPQLRMGGHPAGVGLVPASFQAMCGAGMGGSTAAPIATAGYFPYPSPMHSLYPYAMVGQSNINPSGALAGSNPGGSEQERVGAINGNISLLRPSAPASSSVAMESSWGPQYSHNPYHTGGGSWPGVSAPGSRRNTSFPTTPPLVSTSRSPPGPVGVPTLASISSTVAPPAQAKSTPAPPVKRTAQQFSSAASPRPLKALVPSNEREQTLPATAAAASTNGTIGAPKTQAHDEFSAPPQNSSEGAGEDQEDPVAGGEKDGLELDSGKPEGDDVNSNGEFETDGSGKRRRLTAEERLQRSRERNQLHARKTRQRKKVQLQLLMNRSADLLAEQQRLRQAITDRRTASILLGMSGSDDVQGADGHGGKSKASRDHPPALAAMTGRTPRAGMLSALESDDTGDGSGKGTGGNGSDDLGSESAAGTSCSASSSGRTSSEANSSDGTGCSVASADGGDGGGAAADKLPKVGNPGDTERLLELSQKTRSECTPEELEQIRRERNRMHAKRTRDRKKLHLEATEGTIARLEQENRKLRESMKAMGSGGSIDGGGGSGDPSRMVSSPPPPSSQPTASPTPEAPTVFPQAGQTPQPPIPQCESSQIRSASAPPPQQTTPTPQHQQYASHPHPFLHHSMQQGPHMPQHQLHGGAVAQHVYPSQHQHHHLSHCAHPLVQQSLQPGPSSQPTNMGFYPHSYNAGGSVRGPAGGGSGGGISSDPGGSNTGAAGLVKSGMNSYPSAGRMSSMDYMASSNPHFPTPQVLAFQGPASFPPPLGKGASRMIATAPQGQQHVYSVPEPRGYQGWDMLRHAQGAHLPHSTYAHVHAHAHAGPSGGGAVGSYPSAWNAGAAGVSEISGGTGARGTLVGGVGVAMPETGASRSAAPPLPQFQLSTCDGTVKSGSSSATEERRESKKVVQTAKCWGATGTTSPVPTVMASSGATTRSGKSITSRGSGGSGAGTAASKVGKSSPLSGKSSCASFPAGNGPARHLARARADEKAQEEKKAAAAAATAASKAPVSHSSPDAKAHKTGRPGDERFAQEMRADNDESDCNLARGCQEAWQHLRRERGAKRKRSAESMLAPSSFRSRSADYSGSDSNGDGGSGSSGEGSVGEGSVASNSSSSSWGESEGSSVVPASSTSSEEGRGRYGSGSDGRSPHSGSSPFGSESGSDEMSAGKTREETGKRRKIARPNKASRRSSARDSVVQSPER